MGNSKIERLKTLKAELEALAFPDFPEDIWPVLNNWISKAIPIIQADWPPYYGEFTKVATQPPPKLMSMRFLENESANLEIKKTEWERKSKSIEHIRSNILSFLEGFMTLSDSTEQPTSITALEQVIFICRRFALFAHQLSTRGRARAPLVIEDEYDVQYLLYALLRLFFDDVRPEVWTPSYAGGSSRMDFLLKSEKIVIEAKKTNDSLRDHLIGDQLIIDIERYAEYPDCKTLVHFGVNDRQDDDVLDKARDRRYCWAKTIGVTKCLAQKLPWWSYQQKNSKH